MVNDKKTYSKPALTFDEQIELLKGRGLEIPDPAKAKRHLMNVSYYRLSAYMLPFKVKDSSGAVSDSFLPGTTWNDVFSLYRFDRKFRLLVFDAIERIEIALRTQLIYQLSHKYGSHCQDQRSIFKVISRGARKIDVFKEIQQHISEQLNANKKLTFIEHYLNTYSDPPTPPSWMSVELLYFSELSRICEGLADKADQKAIAKYFRISSVDVFCSWIHSINYIRNICAHHARLWNIMLAIQPMKYHSPDPKVVWLSQEEI